MMRYTGWIVAALIVTLALAGERTGCPSDLNGDGNVATADLLQLLGDWGPCPTSRVIAMSRGHSNWAVRVWSDNTVQLLRRNEAACWLCEESVPFANQEWLTLESPPSTSAPADIGVSDGQDGAQAEVTVAYANGETFVRLVGVDAGEGCNGGPGSHCVFVWTSPWTLIGEPP